MSLLMLEARTHMFTVILSMVKLFFKPLSAIRIRRTFWSPDRTVEMTDGNHELDSKDASGR